MRKYIGVILVSLMMASVVVSADAADEIAGFRSSTVKIYDANGKVVRKAKASDLKEYVGKPVTRAKSGRYQVGTTGEYFSSRHIRTKKGVGQSAGQMCSRTQERKTNKMSSGFGGACK